MPRDVKLDPPLGHGGGEIWGEGGLLPRQFAGPVGPLVESDREPTVEALDSVEPGLCRVALGANEGGRGEDEGAAGHGGALDLV